MWSESCSPVLPVAVSDGAVQPALLEPDLSGWRVRADRYLSLVDRETRAEIADLASCWDRQAGPGDAFDVDPPILLNRMLDRGGKRIRPLMVDLGWMASGASDEDTALADVVRAGVALELLHTFALVHDDVMDGSRTRRGRPSLHDAAHTTHISNDGRGDSRQFGHSVAVLVGDLAHAEADRLAAALPGPMRRIWRTLTVELVAGQLHDLTGTAAGNRELDFARSVARQKSGAYTVTRPLQLGATAAGAGTAVLHALSTYGRSAGEAFALRDDLLGVFGDPAVTGKSAGDDLRSGKPTVLLAIAGTRLQGRSRQLLEAVGTDGLTDLDLRQLRDAMANAGVPDAVESMIADRVGEACSALDVDVLAPAGVDGLTQMLDRLARRQR